MNKIRLLLNIPQTKHRKKNEQIQINIEALELSSNDTHANGLFVAEVY